MRGNPEEELVPAVVIGGAAKTLLPLHPAKVLEHTKRDCDRGSEDGAVHSRQNG